MQKLLLILAYSATLLLAGCSEPKLSPLSENGTILAFGDSLTVGVGTSPNNSYPAILAELTGRQVINAGISGEMTSAGLPRFKGLLEQSTPDIIILLEGGNDILRNGNLTTTRQNISEMIRLAHSRDIDVVLIGVPEKKLFSDSAPFYTELAETYDVVFADEIIAKLLRTPAYKSDAIHFNQPGYQKLAQHIYQLLQDNEAL
ncbi:MAG: GDSL-type esterase/lipase family protein [Amphritea sp.]